MIVVFVEMGTVLLLTMIITSDEGISYESWAILFVGSFCLEMAVFLLFSIIAYVFGSKSIITYYFNLRGFALNLDSLKSWVDIQAEDKNKDLPESMASEERNLTIDYKVSEEDIV